MQQFLLNDAVFTVSVGLAQACPNKSKLMLYLLFISKVFNQLYITNKTRVLQRWKCHAIAKCLKEDWLKVFTVNLQLYH